MGAKVVQRRLEPAGEEVAQQRLEAISALEVQLRLAAAGTEWVLQRLEAVSA